MRSPRVDEKLADLPTVPGCYIYKNRTGRVIYVGKAINLRNRVRSYFQQSANHTAKTRRLVAQIHDLEYIVCSNELEALVLECNLIKRHRPQYNVKLRDDKHYPYLCLTTSEPYPRLFLTRRIRQDGNRYFGPYTSTRTVYATMDLVKDAFPLVTCGKKYTGEYVHRPCLYHELCKCPAPCANLANRDDYARTVKDVVGFLEGKRRGIIKDLRRQMAEASEALEFERAAKLRDRVMAVEQITERQQVISTRMIDQDVIALVTDENDSCVQMLYIRGGKLVGQNHFLLDNAEEGESTAEAVAGFLKDYYESAAVPQEVVLPCDIEETAIVQSWLRQKRGSNVEIAVPLRGERKRLLEMAAENAAHAMVQVRAEQRARMAGGRQSLSELAAIIEMDPPPRRIECFDISNFANEAFVGSMVVCIDGVMAKAEYRRFRIKRQTEHPDDVGMMREVLERRLQAALDDDPKYTDLPDLIIVDGGTGQLDAALKAMETTGLHRPVCGLAKRFELLVLPNRPDPVELPRRSQALFLAQRIRDEAHRFANAYREKLQTKRVLGSVLDSVPGVGPVRRKALLTHFGDVDRIRSATVEELAAAPSMDRRAAEAVHTYFQAPEEE